MRKLDITLPQLAGWDVYEFNNINLKGQLYRKLVAAVSPDAVKILSKWDNPKEFPAGIELWANSPDNTQHYGDNKLILKPVVYYDRSYSEPALGENNLKTVIAPSRCEGIKINQYANKEVAVIGSRETPDSIVELMTDFVAHFCNLGVVFDSGGAPQADRAVEQGYWRAYWNNLEPPTLIRVYLPFSTFEGLDRYLDRPEYIVASTLPAWEEAKVMAANLYNNYGRNKTFNQLGVGIQALGTRNMFQVLGPKLSRPKDVIVFYAKPARDKKLIVEGGTNLAVALGDEYGIPMVNLYYSEQQELLKYAIQNSDLEILTLKGRY